MSKRTRKNKPTPPPTAETPAIETPPIETPAAPPAAEPAPDPTAKRKGEIASVLARLPEAAVSNIIARLAGAPFNVPLSETSAALATARTAALKGIEDCQSRIEALARDDRPAETVAIDRGHLVDALALYADRAAAALRELALARIDDAYAEADRLRAEASAAARESRAAWQKVGRALRPHYGPMDREALAYLLSKPPLAAGAADRKYGVMEGRAGRIEIAFAMLRRGDLAGAGMLA